MEIPRVKVRSFFEEASNIHVRNESTVVGAKKISPTLILPHLEEEKENEEEEKEEEESHQIFPAGGPKSEQKAWNMGGEASFFFLAEYEGHLQKKEDRRNRNVF